MGIGAVLSTAVSGLRVSQASIETVSQNIANAETPGYARRQQTQLENVAGDHAVGVRVGAVNRMLDALAQRQLRLESSGAGYTGTVAQYQSALDKLFGAPGGANSLDTLFNGFTQSLQSLAADPSSYSLRSQTLNTAGALATTLNNLSSDVQALRADAESAIGSAVKRVNELLKQIAAVNGQIVANGLGASPALLDERDRAIDELSTYMDIRAEQNAVGSTTVATGGGLTLFDGMRPLTLSFDERANIGPNSLYSPDAAQRGVGAVAINDGSATPIDLMSSGFIRSGKLAALIELRDRTLVEAQDQLDALAANMSLALSDRDAPTAAVTSGAQTGFDIDLSTLPANGNALTFAWRDASGVTRTARIVRVEDASQLPLPNDGGADRVIGMSFSGAPASIVGALNAAFGPGLVFSSSGSTLRALDGGSTTSFVGAAARITNTALTGQGAEIPLFHDKARNQVFTGSFEGGSSTRGFAQRIAVNPAVVADRSRLVVYQTIPTSTPQGDATRPALMLERLTGATRTFATTTGIGGAGAPFSGTIATFTQRILEHRGAAAESATQLDTGQNVALSAAKSRYEQDAGVNIDVEMAQLTQLQNAYAANARVFTAAREMLEMLMRI